jgi:hypothetical protein
MGNVNLPTPVALAGGAICLLGGYLVGVLAGPETASRATATVASYDTGTGRLCLGGDGVQDQDGLDADGRLCGTWRRAGSSSTPREGERFRFVTVSAGGSGDSAGGDGPVTVIYGDVLR